MKVMGAGKEREGERKREIERNRKYTQFRTI